jgi:HTH-type transcriptional regulator, repressor for puuD
MSSLGIKFGRRLAKIRMDQGLSQNQLAKKIGVVKTSIGRFERDEMFPSVDNLEKLGEALGVPVKDFFDFDRQP